MRASDLITDTASTLANGDFKSTCPSLKDIQDWVSQNPHFKSTPPSVKEIRDWLSQWLPGPSNIETVPVTSDNRHTIANSTPLVTKTITIPIASLCNSDETSARGMRRASTSSSMRCDDGISDSEMLRPIQESDNRRGRSRRVRDPALVRPLPESDTDTSSIAPPAENMRRREHMQNEAPGIEKTRKIYQESLEKQIDCFTRSVSRMDKVLDCYFEEHPLGPVTDHPADRPSARHERKADVYPTPAPKDPDQVRRRIEELMRHLSNPSLDRQEKEEKKSQANSVTNHESQPPKTADPTSDFLPTARSADPGDLAKQERIARIRDLRIDAHRARFSSHLKAVRGVEHTSPVVVNCEHFDEQGSIENMKNGRINVYRAQFGGQVQAAKLVEQPSPVANRNQVDEREQARIEYVKTKRVAVLKGPLDRHTRRAPRVVEKPSPAVRRESIDEQARIEANEKLYHCERVARADVRRDVRRAEDAGRLLAGTTIQVPGKSKAEKADGGAVVDAVTEVPNAKEADDGVVPNAGAEPIKTKKADVGAISVAAPEKSSPENVDGDQDNFSEYDVVERNVPGGASFLAEDGWLVVAKEDGL